MNDRGLSVEELAIRARKSVGTINNLLSGNPTDEPGAANR